MNPDGSFPPDGVRRRLPPLADIAYGLVLGATSVTLGVIGLHLWQGANPPVVTACPPATAPVVVCSDPPPADDRIEPASPQRMTLSIDIEPDDAMLSVFVDGRPLTTGTGDERVVVTGTPATQIELLGASAGHVAVRQRVDFDPDRSRLQIRLLAEPEPASGPPPASPTTEPEAADVDPPEIEAASATLRIGHNRGVPPAQVYVDGVHVGTTPIASHHVTSGPHDVQWRWSDGTSQTQTVTVTGDEVAILRAK